MKFVLTIFIDISIASCKTAYCETLVGVRLTLLCY